MLTKAIAAAAVALSTPAAIAASALGGPTAAQGVGQGLVGGAWTGKFLQTDWTFEFRNEGGAIRGRYVTAGRTNWLPLEDIVISGRSVSFRIESKPKLSFALEVGASAPELAGTVTIDGVATVPFSAKRNP